MSVSRSSDFRIINIAAFRLVLSVLVSDNRLRLRASFVIADVCLYRLAATSLIVGTQNGNPGGHIYRPTINEVPANLFRQTSAITNEALKRSRLSDTNTDNSKRKAAILPAIYNLRTC